MGYSNDPYVENLEECIFDEERIVSYRWLSSYLKVNVNQAKQMLYAFFQKNKEKLRVTFFIAGLAASSSDDEKQVHKCHVVNESALEKVKSSFKVVTSLHIYSLQKCTLKDKEALYTADYDVLKDSMQYSAISCPWATVRSSVPSTFATELQPEFLKSIEDSCKPVASKGIPLGGSQKKGGKQGGIRGMFVKAAKKSEPKEEIHKEEKKDRQVSEDKKERDEKGSSGMTKFFSKEGAKKIEETAASKTAKDSRLEERCVLEEKPSKQKVSGKKRKDTKDSKKSEQQTKRRRIQCVSDSSDEDDNMDEEEKESPVPSPAEEHSTPPSQKKQKHISPDPKKTAVTSVVMIDGKKKRLVVRNKTIPKTYMDADGYMVTEQVTECTEEYESIDEEEPDHAAKRSKSSTGKVAQRNSSPKKKSPVTASGSKQTNLTSFFKKK